MKKIVLILFVIPFFFSNRLYALDGLCNNAKSAILIDSKTNKVLYEKDSNIKLPMASMTKVMTLSIIYDEIKAGNLNYEDIIVTSDYAKSMGGSQVYLEVGEKHKLSELLKCICIASANDASVAVAEHISGSESVFVERMNQKAKELNMHNTKYIDCTGLSDVDHYTSAYDMAIISSYLINNHPEVLNITSQKEAYFREDTEKPFWLVNTNKLVGRHEGVDGLKTGWTNKAGYCMTTTKLKDNFRLISVVMGYQNPIVRNNETVELLNYGFSNFEIINIVKNGDCINTIDNILYKNNKLEIVSKDDLCLVIKKGTKDLISSRYKYIINKDNINKTVGYYDVYYNNEHIDSIELIVKENKRKNLFELFIEILIKSLN